MQTKIKKKKDKKVKLTYRQGMGYKKGHGFGPFYSFNKVLLFLEISSLMEEGVCMDKGAKQSKGKVIKQREREAPLSKYVYIYIYRERERERGKFSRSGECVNSFFFIKRKRKKSVLIVRYSFQEGTGAPLISPMQSQFPQGFSSLNIYITLCLLPPQKKKKNCGPRISCMT